MRNKIKLLLTILVVAANIVGCAESTQVTKVEDIEEVSGNSTSPMVARDVGLKCNKETNPVAYEIVTKAYENAKNMRQATAEISYMDSDYNIISQASIMQDQPTKQTMFYYTEKTETMFNGYLYRYEYKGENEKTTVYIATEYGWLETEAYPPYNVDVLEIFTFEDYTNSKVFEEPVSFLGEDETGTETKYYTLLSAGVSSAEDMENIVRYASVYIEKESMLPVASVIEYVNINSDIEIDMDTGEKVEDVQKTEVVLFTFDNEDITTEVSMNPETDEIIDEQTYLESKAKEANSNE